MNRIVIAIFSALMLLAFPSQAQQIIVVASCPATLSPPLNQGAPGRLTVDVNGILCTNASGGGGGGAITAAANSYATGFSPDIGVFGSMVPYQGSGTANVINLLGGIELDARNPLATQANSISIGGVGILAPLGTQTLANSVAVTAADGTLVTVGTTTDSAWAGTGNATLDAALKGIYNAAVSGTAATGSTTPTSAVLFGISDGTDIRAMAGTSAGVVSMGLVNVGTTAVSASGAPASEPPLFTGGIAESSNQTAVTAGQKVGQEMTLNGKAVVQPYALSGDFNQPANAGQTGTTPITVLSASGSASLSEYMTGYVIGRSDAGSTAITAAFTDGTTTRTIVVPNSGGGGGNNFALPTAWKWAANTAVTCAASSGVTTFYCYATGYNAP